MSQITELERRLTMAMDKIAQSVESLGAAGTAEDAEEVAKLRQALEDEKLANAQLEERVRAIHAKQDGQVKELQAEIEAAKSYIAQLDLDLQRLRTANDELRESNQTLRTANEAGVAEPHLINKAMLGELEALRATRAADMAEADAIIGALEPLLSATALAEAREAAAETATEASPEASPAEAASQDDAQGDAQGDIDLAEAEATGAEISQADKDAATEEQSNA